MVFSGHCNNTFEATSCCYHYCPFEDAPPSLTEAEKKRGFKKRELDELRKQYIQEKGGNVTEMYKCDWWKKYKTNNTVKQHLRESFRYKTPLREQSFLETIKSGSLFGCVQCDIEVPENIREVFANFPPIFNNVNVGRNDIGLFKNE